MFYVFILNTGICFAWWKRVGGRLLVGHVSYILFLTWHRVLFTLIYDIYFYMTFRLCFSLVKKKLERINLLCKWIVAVWNRTATVNYLNGKREWLSRMSGIFEWWKGMPIMVVRRTWMVKGEDYRGCQAYLNVERWWIS